MSNSFPIDFVITWVDESDERWNRKMRKYKFENTDKETSSRFRDYGTFKFLFRSIEKYAPWVNKVFLVTDHQYPEWLKKDYKKIVCISHEEFIEEEYLPTFNSNVIDLNIYRIKGLAEHFVYFNDDTFLNDFVKKEDFFDYKGRPKDSLAMNVIMPSTIFEHTYINNMSFINNKFPKFETIRKNFFKFFSLKNKEWILLNALQLPWPIFSRLYDPHVQLSFKKSVMKDILEKNKMILRSTNKHKFRSAEDYSIWIIRYYQLLSGEFATRNIHFGKAYCLDEYKKIIADIKSPKHKLLCINDSARVNNEDFSNITENIRNEFNKKLGVKSSFEK